MELEVATANLDRWKINQLSAQYERSGPATRKILDNQRLRFSQTVTQIRESLAFALDTLSALPNFAERAKALSDKVKELELVRYNSEMQLWIRSMEALHLELAVPAPPPAAYVDHVTSEKPAVPTTWTWSQIQSLLLHLEDLLATVVEQVYLDRYTLNTDFDGRLSNIRHEEAERLSASRMSHTAVLVAEVDRVGDQIVEASNQTAAHLAVIVQNEAELEQLRDELAKLEKTQQQMKDYMGKFEQWRKDDQAKIQDLTTRLRDLRARPRTPLTPPSPDEMREVLRSVLNKHVDEIGSQFATMLCAACATNNEDFLRAVTTKLQPTLELTEKLFERAGRIQENLLV
ncbi:hypothetical protein DXG03_003404 [Asterophora parasitica]|uniref:Autophagy-related protein 17 n=1 Tax=Asterophora parasitica TaxID=117018 RepID=A0A9P7G161_9AGAR|nr:hypothetical protein DXG03_003404 [Asterophora parasitica]